MKKLLGLLLAITMAWPVSAAIVDNVELKGEVQTIASDALHDATNVYGSGTHYRVLAGFSANLVEDVQANVLFQYHNLWDGNTAGSNLDHYWNQVTLVEANLVLSNLFDRFELTVGRQFYGDEDSALIYFGPDHYIFDMNAAPSLDAAKLYYSDDFKTITLLAGKYTEYDEFGVAQSENDVYGLDIKLNLTDAWKLQAYGYDLKSSEEDWKHVGFYGAKLGYFADAGSLSAEYARGFGGNQLFDEYHNNPYMVKVDAALNVEAFTPRAAFLYGKGVVSPLGNYRPGLLVGHARNIFEYSEDLATGANNGIRMFNIGVDYTAGKWIFSLDGYSFQDRSANEAATLEADLNVKYNHNDYVQLFAGVGYGKYGGNAKEALDAKDNTIGQLGMLVKF